MIDPLQLANRLFGPEPRGSVYIDHMPRYDYVCVDRYCECRRWPTDWRTYTEPELAEPRENGRLYAVHLTITSELRAQAVRPEAPLVVCSLCRHPRHIDPNCPHYEGVDCGNHDITRPVAESIPIVVGCPGCTGCPDEHPGY